MRFQVNSFCLFSGFHDRARQSGEYQCCKSNTLIKLILTTDPVPKEILEKSGEV